MKKIYTHTDFDGVVSASLISIATGIDFVRFISTQKIWYEQFTGNEIVCDLPCPWKCYLWFDHHESNKKEMEARGIDISKIPGRFEIAPSCSRVIYNYFNEKGNVKFPTYFNKLIEETDIIDSMKYNSIDEWLKETPAKILSVTMQLIEKEDYKTFLQYMIKITKLLRNTPPDEIIKLEEVQDRYKRIQEYENEYLNLIKKSSYFPDNSNDILIIDLSELKYAPRLDKNLAYKLNKNIDAILLINSIFKNNNKSNNLRFSMGINFTKDININISSIFEKLGIGGGHPKAAGGVIECNSKKEKLSKKSEYIKKIINLWKIQKNS